MSVEITFPEELLVASKEDRAQFTRRVMIYTLGHLYQEGKISAGVGANILQCDRREFYRLLSDYGFPVIDYAHDELAEEAQTSRNLAETLKKRDGGR